MIENQPLPLEGIDENRFAVHLADFEIVRMVADKLGLEYGEGWSYKVVHPNTENGHTLVMAKKDDVEERSALIVP